MSQGIENIMNENDLVCICFDCIKKQNEKEDLRFLVSYSIGMALLVKTVVSSNLSQL